MTEDRFIIEYTRGDGYDTTFHSDRHLFEDEAQAIKYLLMRGMVQVYHRGFSYFKFRKGEEDKDYEVSSTTAGIKKVVPYSKPEVPV